MKYAPIAPVPDKAGFMQLSSYHLVIAREVLKSPSYWSGLCRYWHGRGDFIILDNGAVEGGTLSMKELLTIAEDIRPDEIVLPDVLGDAEGTLRVINDSRREIELIPPYMRMFVAQGKTMEEWSYCLFARTAGYGTLGIPKRALGAQPRDRQEILHYLGRIHYEHPIHLLGFLGNPLEDIKMTMMSSPVPIRGVDSAAPVAWAQNGHVDFSGGTGPYSVNLDALIGDPYQVTAVYNMIWQLQEACDGAV